MARFPNRPAPYDERPEFNDNPLASGTHVCVIQPWPAEKVKHDHPWEAGVVTQSWPVKFEGVTDGSTVGGVVTLWIECDENGAIAETHLGEGRWKYIREALELPESDDFCTDVLKWAIIKLTVKERFSRKKQ